MKEFLAVTKALADEHRVRALLCLFSGELCVCQIVEMLGLAPSTVSKHMAILHQAGLVEFRKDGRWIYYALARRGASSCVRGAFAWLRRCLARDPVRGRDARRLKRVRRIGLDKLCACYRT